MSKFKVKMDIDSKRETTEEFMRLIIDTAIDFLNKCEDDKYQGAYMLMDMINSIASIIRFQCKKDKKYQSRLFEICVVELIQRHQDFINGKSDLPISRLQ